MGRGRERVLEPRLGSGRLGGARDRPRGRQQVHPESQRALAQAGREDAEPLAALPACNLLLLRRHSRGHG